MKSTSYSCGVWTGGGRSLPDLVTTLEELNHLGVGFVSLTEALDLTTPTGRAMAGMLPYSPRSNMKSCGNEYVPVSLMPGRMESGWADLPRLLSNQPKSASCIAPVSARPRSREG